MNTKEIPTEDEVIGYIGKWFLFDWDGKGSDDESTLKAVNGEFIRITGIAENCDQPPATGEWYLDAETVSGKKIQVFDTELEEPDLVRTCGPQKNCNDGKGHDYSDEDSYKTPEGAYVNTAVCVKCGQDAFSESLWN